MDALPTHPYAVLDAISRTASAVQDAVAMLVPYSARSPVGTTAVTEDAATEDAAVIDAIGRIESLKNSLDAVQSSLEVSLRQARVRSERAAGVPLARRGTGVGHEIGLARRISPARAGNQLALRRVVVESLPEIWRRMAQGDISAWAAEEVARAVLVLDDEDRARIDSELAPSIHELSPRAAGRRARAQADDLDREAALARMRLNHSQRRVTQRPAAEGMMTLSALLPLTEGVSAFASLRAAADAARARGDDRSRGQIMADTLAARITGHEAAAAPVEIQLLMTDRSLLAGGADPALLEGHPLPGPVARHLALHDAPAVPARPANHPHPGDGLSSAGDPRPADEPHPAGLRSAPTPTGPTGSAARARRWVRRLYTDPVSGSLVHMDSRRRLFTGDVRRFILARDQQCRTPWCEAPIRHIDHVHRHADGGTTTPDNGVGVCERFNHVLELPGWVSSLITEGAHTGTLEITAPTGHRYRSPVPDLDRMLGLTPGAAPDTAAPASPDPPRTLAPPGALDPPVRSQLDKLANHVSGTGTVRMRG
ncbi:HNH endonuclease [Brachybacterium sp. p3-SID957]|uniref:HNH endonuclease signature motif containing protein n=1 Tax=Brachybacterium sp. p3-SID957 TaxID=2916049 RepID=UPI00223B7FA9|nr:HNH endonuclease [Brachybacterium sp. p3-SID957]MCT1774819.1 HNH endonuclease [Brachybacterium sp. p3-SID957]